MNLASSILAVYRYSKSSASRSSMHTVSNILESRAIGTFSNFQPSDLNQVCHGRIHRNHTSQMNRSGMAMGKPWAGLLLGCSIRNCNNVSDWILFNVPQKD